MSYDKYRYEREKTIKKERRAERAVGAKRVQVSARAAHLEGSSQELGRRGRTLQLRYYRERREAIDRNIRELFAAKSLFSSERGEL